MYPTFFRVVPGHRNLNTARCRLIYHFNWRRVGTLKQSDDPRFALVYLIYSFLVCFIGFPHFMTNIWFICINLDSERFRLIQILMNSIFLIFFYLLRLFAFFHFLDFSVSTKYNKIVDGLKVKENRNFLFFVKALKKWKSAQ